ncbi:MAG TPA: hypothetical protein VGG32_05960 [Thermoplasmata archaeon]|jgi:hypothetical protein
MPIFEVKIPAASFQVEAENDACAIDRALDQYRFIQAKTEALTPTVRRLGPSLSDF